MTALCTTLCCTNIGGGGEGGSGGGGGEGGEGGGIPPTKQANPHQVIIPAADVRMMGSLPPQFDGDRAKADKFLLSMRNYLMLNQDIAGYNSPMKKVAQALSLIMGDQTKGWVRDLIGWLKSLDPALNNVPTV